MTVIRWVGLFATLLGVLVAGCGGSGDGVWDGDATLDDLAARVGPFRVRTASGAAPTEVDFTPSGGSRFSYIGVQAQDIVRVLWTCRRPPPADLTPILYLGEDTDAEIYAIMPSGEGRRQLTDNDANDGHPGWSPDGTEIVFNSTRSGNGDVWIMNAAGTQARNLTNHPATDGAARWNPQGEWIAFKSNRTGRRDIYSIRVDGSQTRQLTAHPAFERAPEWFPDGRRLLFSSNRDGDQDIYRMTRFGQRVTQLIDSPDADFRATVSPDGSKIAFHSLRDRNLEVYVMDVDGSNQVNITNRPGKDAHPEWAPDGTRIVFNSDRTGVSQVWTMRPDGSDPRQVTTDPNVAVQCVGWNVPGSRRVLVGHRGSDAGYDPPFGHRTAALLAAYDGSSLRSAVGISAAGGAGVFLRKGAGERSVPRVYVRSAGALTVIEDRVRLLEPITHLQETDGIRRCLVKFSPSTGHVRAVKSL